MFNINKKYLCKKNSLYCIKGNIYDIHMISFNCISIYLDNYFIYENFIFEEGFYTDLYFYDYFYTEKEERKLKLRKINNVR
jgi:hypothetical protein